MVESDRGSLVLITTYLLVSIAAFFVILRGFARYRVNHVWEAADVLLLTCLVSPIFVLSVALLSNPRLIPGKLFGIFQSVCVHATVMNGLGHHLSTLSEAQLTGYLKV